MAEGAPCVFSLTCDMKAERGSQVFGPFVYISDREPIPGDVLHIQVPGKGIGIVKVDKSECPGEDRQPMPLIARSSDSIPKCKVRGTLIRWKQV